MVNVVVIVFGEFDELCLMFDWLCGNVKWMIMFVFGDKYVCVDVLLFDLFVLNLDVEIVVLGLYMNFGYGCGLFDLCVDFVCVLVVCILCYLLIGMFEYLCDYFGYVLQDGKVIKGVLIVVCGLFEKFLFEYELDVGVFYIVVLFIGGCFELMLYLLCKFVNGMLSVWLVFDGIDGVFEFVQNKLCFDIDCVYYKCVVLMKVVGCIDDFGNLLYLLLIIDGYVQGLFVDLIDYVDNSLFGMMSNYIGQWIDVQGFVLFVFKIMILQYVVYLYMYIEGVFGFGGNMLLMSGVLLLLVLCGSVCFIEVGVLLYVLLGCFFGGLVCVNGIFQLYGLYVVDVDGWFVFDVVCGLNLYGVVVVLFEYVVGDVLYKVVVCGVLGCLFDVSV